MKGGHVDLFALELTAQSVQVSLKAPVVVVRRAAIALFRRKKYKIWHQLTLQYQIVIYPFHMKRIFASELFEVIAFL